MADNLARPLQTIPGIRTGSTVFHANDGFFYHVVNRRENRRFMYLRCMHYDRQGNRCFGSAKALPEENLMWHMRRHSHPPNVHHREERLLRQAVFRRVAEGDQTPFHEILQQEGLRFPLEVRAAVALGNIELRMQAIRAALRPNVPRSLGVLGAILEMPEYEYLTCSPHIEGSIYAGMCGSMREGTLSLVFISQEMMRFMEGRTLVFADGTERKKFSQPKMSQIFTIVGVWGHQIIPMLRALMIRRTEEAYVVLFNFMRRLMPTFSPTEIKTDFEDGQVNAWQRVFPRATVEGCLWHFDVAVFKKARKLGLTRLISEQPAVSSIIRSTGALPLLPAEDITAGLRALGQEARDEGWMRELRPFFRYMERQWLPKIAILSVKGSDHRTNNASESGNRALNKEIRVARPSCFQVVRAILLSHDRALNDKRQVQELRAPGRGRKLSAIRNDIHIQRATRAYDNGDINILRFLHLTSRRMQNVFNQVFPAQAQEQLEQ